MTETSAKPAGLTESRYEHVLVVEDDDLVRAHVVELVASLGYRVSESSDGPSGLAIIRARDDIDLLFSDIVMTGGMSGLDLAEAAVRLRPGLRILFTSGHSRESIVSNLQADQDIDLLQKPYNRQDLAQRLRKMFDG